MCAQSVNRSLAWPLLLLIGTTIQATCSCPVIDAAERPPNVLVVITDDQGYGDIGFHGNREIQTPTLDTLARGSLRFTNFHVEPTCSETRTALLTGQYPLRGGVWHTIMGRSILRASAVTLPQLFRQAGYRTGMFGKWHLGDNYPYRPQDRGFDQTLHLGGGGASHLPDVWGNDYFDDVYWSRDKLQPVRGYCTDVFFNAASQFIRAESDKPFFCYLATNAPHAPYNVPESYKKPYLEQGIAEPRASFYGMISNIDTNLSKLLTQLDQQGIAEDTIVVFLTDNGSAAGYIPPSQSQPAQGFNAGMRGLKGSPYEGGHRVPLFIRYGRKLPVDRDFPGLCAHIDLVPTLAELCGLDTSSIRPLDGRNLVGYANGSLPWSDRTLIVQSHRVEEPVQWNKSSVMTDRWRLIDGKELYDLQQDPGQSESLPAEQHAATIEELRNAYEKWWQDMAVDPQNYSRIVLGASAAERVRLTSHDWHGPQPPWAQSQVKQDPVTEGFWAVDVARPGAYQFLLSRRPLEQPGPISATRARIEIAGQSIEVAVQPSAILVPITVRLPAGPTKLFTQLIAADGQKTGAYFVMVNYLGDIPQTVLDGHAERMPQWLQPGDRIAWLGGTFIERGADTGALEAETMLRAPLAGLTTANLGWSGDDFTGRARAVFGSSADGKARRLNDLRMSGASLVMIAYGMSELLDPQLDTAKIKTYEADLRELIATLKSEGRRSVLCLPPPLVDDIEGSAAKPIYAATCEAYMRRRPQLVEMLERVAAAEELPTLSLPAVKTSLFESGTYLSPAGFKRWATDALDSLFESAKQPSIASRAQEQRLYDLARENNRLFFDMHRPQNETYLLLFRKHEQGNNAVEIDQYRPLIAEVQHELIHAAARQ